MSWKAIRCISKMTEQELWHPRRTERPVLLNRITNAAEEAVKLLPKFLQAMAMLEDLAQTLNDVPGHEGYEDLARNAGEFVFSESYHGYTCWEFEYAEKLQKKAGLFDRAVELLRQADRVLDQHVSAKEYLDTQASVRVFLGELEVE